MTLHPDVLSRLGSDGDRVSSKTIEMAQKSVLPELEKHFHQFWAVSTYHIKFTCAALLFASIHNVFC